MRRCAVLLALGQACAPQSVPTPAAQGQAAAAPEPSPEAEAEPEPIPEPAPPAKTEVCASVGIGLDLRALPHPVETDDATSFTRGQAHDFRELAPATVSVEIYSQPGMAAFTAKLGAAKGVDLLAHCERMTAAFMPTVPGHPMSHKPGGSVTAPCALMACDAAP